MLQFGYTLKPKYLTKILVSSDTNCVPLSDTSWIGTPYCKNHLPRNALVFEVFYSFNFNFYPFTLTIKHY